MRPLRPILDRPLHHDGDPYDDGPLPDLTSGLMWTATGVVGIAVQPLPGSDHSHTGWVIALGAFAIVWGAISVMLGLRGKIMPLRQRALVTADMMPLVALALPDTSPAPPSSPPRWPA
jgi:hypothetical protein